MTSVRTNEPPTWDILPSNVPDFPAEPPSRHRRSVSTLRLLLAILATGTLLGVVQTVVGFDQLARWAVSVASNARLPGSDLPQSRNWAGYAATGGVFTEVSATWSVPPVATVLVAPQPAEPRATSPAASSDRVGRLVRTAS